MPTLSTTISRDFPHIRFGVTEKLLKNKFGYRVEVDTYSNWKKFTTTFPSATSVVSRYSYHVAPLILSVWCDEHIANNEWSMNINFRKTFVWFGNDIATTAFARRFGEYVVSINEPYNDTALMAMSDQTVRVRKSMYWGRYQYKFTLSRLPMYQCEEMRSTFDADQLMISYGSPTRVYALDDVAATMFMVGYADKVSKIERAVVLKDFEP